MAKLVDRHGAEIVARINAPSATPGTNRVRVSGSTLCWQVQTPVDSTPDG
jgi:hypothetical protein